LKKLSRIVWNLMSDWWIGWMNTRRFLLHWWALKLLTFSTGSNISSEMGFICKAFILLTYISWLLVQNKRIWHCFWMSFFWFGENKIHFVALTSEYILATSPLMKGPAAKGRTITHHWVITELWVVSWLLPFWRKLCNACRYELI